ncbi:MAG: histidine phosphatase family protein [Clostridia bacterium]|nr:histidine phosphatase family protein [Clostridia bacterium]
MEIYVIRHGETDGNKEGIMQGWLDLPLNDFGRKLAIDTGRAMKGIHFDAAITSPLLRAKETAELLLKESGNTETPLLFDDRLKEVFAGEWEGKCFRPGHPDEAALSEEARNALFGNPLTAPQYPGGESIRDVIARTQEFLWELVKEEKYERVLVSTHGCALRAMLNFLYPDPSDFWQGHIPYNCSISILSAHNGKVKLLESDKIFYDPADCVDRYKFVK